MHTKSTPIPTDGKACVTHQHTNCAYVFNLTCVFVLSHTVVNHSLLGQDHEQAVNFEHTHPRCDDYGHLASAVKVTVDVVLVKNWGRQKW